MTTATASGLFESGKATLELARRCTLKLADGIPPDSLCHQPVAKTNHALWVLGHLAWTDNLFLTTLAKREPVVDESWNKLFGMGSEPTGDPQAYPTLDEVKGRLEAAREALIDWFQSLDEQQLKSPLPDGMKAFASDYAGMMNSLAWHEGLHAGQLSAVRRSLGLPRALED